MYIDTHCHLGGYEENFKDCWAQEGLELAIDVGFDLESSREAAERAGSDPRIYCAVGVHPEDCAAYDDAAEAELIRLAGLPKTVAIGEIGLDYHYEPFDKIRQQEVFLRQLEVAHRLRLPFSIHLRDAAGDMNDLLRAHRELITCGGVMHCYAQSAELVKFYLDLGLYLSFAGPVTFKNARGLLDAVRAVPLDRILTETDCPYLTPEPLRGKKNYPHYVQYTAARIAELKGVPTQTLCDSVRENVYRLFSRIVPEN